MIVLDASVIFKWFLEEPGSEQALQFEHNHVVGEELIVAPDLLFYEIANIFRYKKNITQDTVDSAFEVLARMEIRAFVFSPAELKEVFKFARTYDISVYDALYAVLARKLGCSFVTADTILYTKLEKFSWVRQL